MVAVVWSGIGLLLVVLLTTAWWFDRDARRRGATPLTGGEMVRTRRQARMETARLESDVFTKGATPRTLDAARDIWAGGTSEDRRRD